MTNCSIQISAMCHELPKFTKSTIANFFTHLKNQKWMGLQECHNFFTIYGFIRFLKYMHGPEGIEKTCMYGLSRRSTDLIQEPTLEPTIPTYYLRLIFGPIGLHS